MMSVAEPALTDVADDTHDRHPRIPVGRNVDTPLDAAADRILIRPQLMRQLVIEDDDALLETVRVNEVAASLERDAEGLEIASARPRRGDHAIEVGEERWAVESAVKARLSSTRGGDDPFPVPHRSSHPEWLERHRSAAD